VVDPRSGVRDVEGLMIAEKIAADVASTTATS